MVGLIGFSHHYTKMHGQQFGVLLKVYQQFINDAYINSETMVYDTEYIDEKGDKAYFPMKEGRYVMLVFLGEKNIPFTTYRKWHDDYKPILPNHWDGYTPYSDLEGMTFSFKFQGEAISRQYRPYVDKWDVKIFD